MTEPATPHDKPALLTRIQAANDALDAVLRTGAAEQMTAPLLDAARSIKDLLAHIAAWEEFMVLDVRESLGEPAPPPDFADLHSAEELNPRIHEKYRDYDLPAVREKRARAYAAVLALIERAPEPALFAGPGAPATLKLIAENTYEHYDEHRAEIERALAAR